MKKDVKKIVTKKTVVKSYSGDEVKHYLGSLSEDFQHKVSAIGEQFSSLHNDVREIKKTLNSNTEMVGKLIVDVTVIKGDIQEIKTDVKQKIDRTEFARLEKRVLAIESREYFGKTRK